MTFFFTSIFLIMTFWRPQEWLVPWMFGWPVLDVVVVMAILTLMMEIDTGKVSWPRDAPMQPTMLDSYADLVANGSNEFQFFREKLVQSPCGHRQHSLNVPVRL